MIEPANPELVYVPVYNPSWAYGPWPYPAYPPYYYPPPPAYGYGAALATGFMFGVGVAAAGAMFGGWNWGGHGNNYVNVNVNRAVTIDNNFNHGRYPDGVWQHDPVHRDGVPYRNAATADRFNQNRPGAAHRNQFRGQLDGGQRAGEPATVRTTRSVRRARIAAARSTAWIAAAARSTARPRAAMANSRGHHRGVDAADSAGAETGVLAAANAVAEDGDERNDFSSGPARPRSGRGTCHRRESAAGVAQGFATPDDAADALANAIRHDDEAALASMIGPNWRSLLPRRADDVAHQRDTFLANWDAQHSSAITPDGNKAVLQIGVNGWTVPLPLVKEGGAWHFDFDAAKKEILARQIGRNELTVVQTLLAIVDAQRDYADARPDENRHAATMRGA